MIYFFLKINICVKPIFSTICLFIPIDPKIPQIFFIQTPILSMFQKTYQKISLYYKDLQDIILKVRRIPIVIYDNFHLFPRTLNRIIPQNKSYGVFAISLAMFYIFPQQTPIHTFGYQLCWHIS